MKPTLLLRQAQRLTMTPQLRQALSLLQMSALELNKTLHEALEILMPDEERVFWP